MKPDRIKISHEFPGLWLAVEIPIAPDENVIDEFKKGKSLLVEAYRELAEPNLVPISEALGITQVDSKETEVEKLLKTISECPTLRNLEIFANTVQRLNEDVLYEAYNKKKIELQ